MTTDILGLDLALTMGWSRVVGGRVYESGVIDWRPKREGDGRHNGHAFMALYSWLCVQAGDETQIAYELAHHRGGPATRLACGWQATVQLFAARLSLPPPLTVATMTLKKWATGSGRADKRAMQDWAAGQLKRRPLDDNEADACAVALWSANQIARKTVDACTGE